MAKFASLAKCAAALSLAVAASASQAYATFEGQPVWANGAGAIVTWSVMPEGTGVVRTPSSPPFLFEDFWTGTNDLNSVYAQLSADPAIGKSLFNTALTNAFATWSAAANVSFVQVADDGSPIGFTGATAGKVGDIRIGAYGFLSPFDAVAAHTFEPPGGTSALAAYWATTNQQSDFGDLNLNANALFGIAPGAEGDAFDFSAGYFNDLQGLLLHEIGHALGLAHPDDDGVLNPAEAASVMNVATGCCDNIHRTLGQDDIAGIHSLYGARLVANDVPEPSTLLLVCAALIGCWAVRRSVSPSELASPPAWPGPA